MASRISHILVPVLVLLAATASARADFSDGKMPDGTYHCEVYLLGLLFSHCHVIVWGRRLLSGRLLRYRLRWWHFLLLSMMFHVNVNVYSYKSSSLRNEP